MSKKKSYESDINVSCDILFSILVGLPVKSLLCFRSISTSWNDIISDKKFKKAHIDRSKVLGCINFLSKSYINNDFKFINLKSNRVITIEKQQFLLDGFNFSHVLCSHDGLVLLNNDADYKTFVLWNRSTRQCLNLPSCPYDEMLCCDPQCYGLCYDPTTDDCKFILIYKQFYLVYSTRNFWTKKITLPQLINNTWSSMGITISGCVYWSSRAPDNRITSTILCFDVKSYELKKLPLPNFVSEIYNDHFFYLINLEGRLCLYSMQNNYELEADMWIMEDDSWKLLMKLPDLISEFCEVTYILYCAENGEIIFEGPKSSTISIYNTKQQKFVVKNIIMDIGYGYGDPYPIGLDSLYFPKIMH